MSNKTIVFLLVILAIAAFFRLWQLDSIPPGLYPDVAINGNDALDSLKTGNFKVFYPENNGREGLFIWLIAASFSIFGISIWSIKIVAAIIGILTVLGLYLLTKELFSKLAENSSRPIALLSSFFLAVSFWHVNFSRIGFRAILLPFVLVFGFYFLFKGFREKRILDFIIAGLFFGLGFYTYISYRFIVILLPLILIFWWLIYRKQNLQKQFLLSIFYFLFSIFIVALPIGFYFLQNPQAFVSRATDVSVFAQQNPIKAFGESLVKHLGMFNFYGDPNWRHNISGAPILFWPIGILFLIGLFYSISQIKKMPFGVLFAWWLIMLLPGVLTYEGIPHALRTIGVIPAVYIFAGLGGWKIYQWLAQNTKHKKLLFASVLIFLLMDSVVEFDKYFNKWAKNQEVKNAFSADYVEIGNYLNSLPSGIKIYVIVNMPGVPVPWPDGNPIPAQTPMFIERIKFGEPRATYLKPEDLEKIKIGDIKTVILPMRYEEDLFTKLLQKFPQGTLEKEDNIWFYKINF